MYHTFGRGRFYAALISIVFILAALFAAWLAYNAGINVAENRAREKSSSKPVVNRLEVPLTTISLAENAGLEKASGLMKINKDAGTLEIEVAFPGGVNIPEGAALAGWLVDAGKMGGLGATSARDDDQKYGTPFANIDFSNRVNEAPYALSVGKFEWNAESQTFQLVYESSNSLAPYDAVMVTVESDGNLGDYDPRPGTPVLIGEILP